VNSSAAVSFMGRLVLRQHFALSATGNQLRILAVRFSFAAAVSEASRH
jgi:hypothetical protein